MKLTKRVMAMLLALVTLVSSCPVSALASTETGDDSSALLAYDGFLYKILPDGTISICGYNGTAETDEYTYWEIPEQIEGVAVTQIEASAFSDNAVVDAIMLPESIKTVGDAACSNCTDLDVIAFLGEIPAFDTTFAQGCKDLDRILVLQDADLSALLSILEEDLGADVAKQITFEQYEDSAALNAAVSALKTGVAETVEDTDASTDATDPVIATEPSVVVMESAQNAVEQTADIVAEGTCGDSLGWVLRADGVLTITGSGEMTNYSKAGAPWYEYRSSITSVVIGSGVERIGSYAFYECIALADVEIPQSLITVGDYAFFNCKALSGNVVFPDRISFIGSYAFYGCVALSGIVLPAQLVTISPYAFYGCTGLAGMLSIPAAVNTIGNYAFYNCTGLTGLTLSESLTTIGNAAFYQCSGLSGDLTIPSAVSSIGSEAFRFCTGLKGKLTIKEGPKTIGSYAFTGCTGLTELELGEGITQIGNNAFYGCSSLTGELVIPESVTRIDSQAFYNCKGFTGTLKLPEGLTVLGSNVFYNCSGITGELVIPDGLTSLENYVFQGMTGVTSLVFGENFTYLDNYYGKSPLQGMTGLKEITFNSLKVPTYYSSYSPFSGLNSLEKIFVPAESYSIYATAYQSILPSGTRLVSIGVEGDFQIEDGVLTAYLGAGGEVTIPEEVTAVADYAFANNVAVTKVTFSGETASIGAHAFDGCTGLTEVVFHEGLAVIGDYAFEGCTALASLALPAGLETIGTYAFSGCKGISGNVAIPEGVTSVGIHAFENCSGMTGLSLPSTLKQIGEYTFKNCTGMQTVEFKEGLEVIGVQAFYNCTGLTGLVLPESLTTIGNAAFYQCSGLSGDLTIPSAVSSIGSEAFRFCTGLKGKLTIKEGPKTIGSYAFTGCTGLTELELGEGITQIGNNAFYGCSSLTGELVIPESVTRIDSQAFYNCKGFTGTLKLPEGLTVLGSNVFYNCSGITGELVIPDGLTSLENYVFQGMTGVTSLVFGENFTYLDNYYGKSPLQGMTGLKEITFNSLKVPTYYSSYSPFSGLNSLEKIFVPAESFDAYVAAYGSKVGENVEITSDFLKAGVSNLQYARLYGKTVSLIWDPHKNESVVGYRILRDGVLVGDVAACGFTERNLTTGKAYTYSVAGYTEDGRETGITQITVTPSAPAVADIKTDGPLYMLNGKNTIYAYVINNKNLESFEEGNVTADLYRITDTGKVWIGQAAMDEKLSSASLAVYTAQWDLTGIADGEYTVQLCVTDVDGVSTEFEKTVTVDNSVPVQITGVTATAAETGICLNWDIAPEEDTLAYRIYRKTKGAEAPRLLQQINDRNTLTFTDSAITEDEVYCYYVLGVNAYGQEGIPSETVVIMLAKDDEAPVVTGFLPADGNVLTGEVRIQMTSTDNVEVTGTQLYYSQDDGATWTLLAESEMPEITVPVDTRELNDGIFCVKGIALDETGNQSAECTYSYFIDNTGPEQIQGLAWEATGESVTLRWDASTDKNFSHYRVERKESDGSYSTVTDLTATAISLYSLEPDTVYTYRVVGYDIYGNRGVASEALDITTQNDTVAPQITYVAPLSGLCKDELEITVIAEDSFCVASITVQISTDRVKWTDLQTEVYEDRRTIRSQQWKLSVADYPEGTLYIRAVATDPAGNMSTTGADATYAVFTVDRTAPSAVKELSANAQDGMIVLTWAKQPDSAAYAVYRLDAESEEFILLADGLTGVEFYDRTVAADTEYSYKVAALDAAGNRSELSEAVTVHSEADTQAPEITAIYPVSGSVVGPANCTVTATAVDNLSLSSIIVEYSSDAETFLPLLEVTEIEGYGQIVDVQLPVEQFADGDTIYLRLVARDQAGLTGECRLVQYVVDKRAPSIREPEAEYRDGAVQLTWCGNDELDLLGYQVYRKETHEAEFTLLGNVPAVQGQLDYGCADSNLPKEAVSYIYQIEAVDRNGNTSMVQLKELALPDRSLTVYYAPYASLSCGTVMAEGCAYLFDAAESNDDTGIVSYVFDFGDGSTASGKQVYHTYKSVGQYTVTLTVTDTDGLTSTAQRLITVREKSAVSVARIQIVDVNGNPISGAPVYFDVGKDSQVIKRTDSNGYAVFDADAGVHTVGCHIDTNWLPVMAEMRLTEGYETTKVLAMERHMMVSTSLTATRMSYQEIVDAGIDVTNEDNQHIVRFNLKITYEGMEIGVGDVDRNMTTGEFIGGNSVPYRSPGRPGKGNGSKGSGWLGGGTLNPGNPPKYPGDEEEEEEEGEDRVLTVQPVEMMPGAGAMAILDVPIEAKFLKEFFYVQAHIVNYSEQGISLVDNAIQLHIPEGMTEIQCEATSMGVLGGGQAIIPEIPGQTAAGVTWVLRGDREGVYPLTASYTGKLKGFDAPVSAQLKTELPIAVYGLSAIKLTAEVNTTLSYDTVYLRLTMKNVSDLIVNLPAMNIPDQIFTTLKELIIEPETPEEEGSGESKDETTGETAAETTGEGTDGGKDKNDGSGGIVTEVTKEAEVKFLNSQLTNAAGYSQYFTSESEITFLAKGEALSNSYAVYNVIDRDYVMFLKEVLSDLEENSGLEFEIIETNLDVYNETSALEKVQHINAGEIFFVTNHLNHFYMVQTLDHDSSKINMLGEAIYASASLMFGGNSDLATNSDIEKQTRAMVVQLLKGEAMEQTIQSETNYTYQKIVNGVVDMLGGIDPDEGDPLEEFLENEADIAGLTGTLQKKGSAEFEKKLMDGLIKKGIEGVSKDVLKGYLTDATLKEVTTYFKHAGHTLKIATSAFEKNDEVAKDLIAIIASRNSAEKLLKMLIDDAYPDSPVTKELKAIQKEVLQDGYDAHIDEFLKELHSQASSAVGENLPSIISPITEKFFGANLGTATAFCKLVFTAADGYFNIGETVELHRTSRVNAELSISLAKSAQKYGNYKAWCEITDPAEAAHTLEAFRALFEMRLKAESQYIYSCMKKTEEEQLAILNDLNVYFDTAYQSLDEYLLDYNDKMIRLRDGLFSTYYSDPFRPKAPEVTLDMVNMCTVETFSSDYVYSYDCRQWFACTGDKIYFEVGITDQFLNVREKETKDSPAGNICSVRIPGTPVITGYVSAVHTGSEYQITGLQEGTYSYGFADSKIIPDMPNTFTVKQGEKVILHESQRYDYLVIRKNATDAAVASQARFLVTENLKKAWSVDTQRKLVQDLQEGTGIQAVKDYYGALDMHVGITTSEDDLAEMLGTGCLIYLNGDAFTAVVRGDVNGDAKVDINDLYNMLKHINSEETLDGAYFEAGRVTGSEDVDIFDIYSELEYINTGSFTQ